MVGRLLVVLILLGSCSVNARTLTLGPSVKPKAKVLNLWLHDLSPKMSKAVWMAANIVKKQVLYGPSCPDIDITYVGDTELHHGVNFFDNQVGPGIEFNGCEKPYSVGTRSGNFAIVNFCEQRIYHWAHPLDPDVYLATHMLARTMGLPKSHSTKSRASFTANNDSLRKNGIDGIPVVSFRFMEAEVKALRKRYCN